jgi:hypothetical protein
MRVWNFENTNYLPITLLCLNKYKHKMKTIKLSLLGIMVMLAASLRAQTTVYDNPGGTYTINSNITYSGDVEIKPLTTLIITSGTQVIMPKDKKIILSSGGARLIVYGTITSNPSNITADMWHGIVVNGNINDGLPAVSMVLAWATGAPYVTSHGVVIMDGASIVGAKTGVYANNKGIIHVNNTSFDYCGISIRVAATSAILQKDFNTICRIQNSNFTARTNASVFGQVISDGVYGIDIQNTKFEMQGSVKSKSAIGGIGAFRIKECNFNNFYEAISLAVNPIYQYYNYYHANTFTDNKFGLRLGGLDRVSIENNVFNSISHSSGDVAVRLAGSTGFTFKGNHFEGYYNGNGYENETAVILENSGKLGNRINNNTFHQNMRGITNVHNNRGLQIKCNTFTAEPSVVTQGDIRVQSSSSFNINTVGIPNQGAIVINDNIGYYLAGNLFSYQCYLNENNHGDISVDDNVPSFKYRHHRYLSNQRIKPNCYTDTLVFPEESTIAYDNRRENACALQYTNIGDIEERIADKETLIGVLLYEMPEGYQQQVAYLRQSIEADVYAIVLLYLEDENEEGLITFLNQNMTPQKRMIYVQQLINMDSLAKASTQVALLDADSLNPDIEVFKDYYTRIIELLDEEADFTNLDQADIDFFEAIAATATPTSAKAQGLLDMNSEQNMTGIARTFKSHSDLNVYPNPASDRVQINELQTDCQYIIYDYAMREVSKGRTIEKTVETYHLQNGIYFIKLFIGEKNYTMRFIINH